MKNNISGEVRILCLFPIIAPVYITLLLLHTKAHPVLILFSSALIILGVILSRLATKDFGSERDPNYDSKKDVKTRTVELKEKDGTKKTIRVTEGDPKLIRANMRKHWGISPLTVSSIGVSANVLISLIILTIGLISSEPVQNYGAQASITLFYWIIAVSYLAYGIAYGWKKVAIAEMGVILVLGKRVFRRRYALDEGVHIILPPPLMNFVFVDIAENTINIPAKDDPKKKLVILVGIDPMEGAGGGSAEKDTNFRAAVWIKLTVSYMIEDPWAILDVARGGGDDYEKAFNAVIIEGLRDTAEAGALKMGALYPNPLEFLSAVHKLDENGVTLGRKIVDSGENLKELRDRWGVAFFTSIVTNGGFDDPEMNTAFSGRAREKFEREAQITEADTVKQLDDLYKKLFPDLSDQDRLLAIHGQMSKIDRENIVITGGENVDSIMKAASLLRGGK